MEFLVFVLIGAAVVVGVYLAYRAAEKRRQALRDFAGQLGMRFTAAKDRGFDDRHTHGAFRQGRSRAAYNRIEGDLEIDGHRYGCAMGDFQYTVQTGKNSTTYRFSFLLLRMPWRVPDLHIRPEHFGDKIMGAIGFDDIDFESEEFSRKFMVKGTDKKFTYAVVHPRMMEYLLSVRGPTVEIRDGEALLMTSRSTWNPDEFRANISWAKRFFDLWPDHLTTQLGEGRA